MKTADVLEYAQVAVGFKVFEGKYVVVEPECQGVDRHYVGCKSEPWSIGQIVRIAMLPEPDQLTITVEIQINEAKKSSIRQRFSERLEGGDFPFRQTAADLEAERKEKAEAADRALAKKAIEDAEKANKKAIEDANKAEKKAIEDAAAAGRAAAIEENRKRTKAAQEDDPAWKTKQEELENSFHGMDHYD